MYEIIMTDEFEGWLQSLKDEKAAVAIVDHVGRMKAGNLGVTRQVAGDIYEKKINVSGGYRVYYFIRRARLMILLNGGTKRTQERDIKRAIKIRKDIYESQIA